MSDCGKWHTAVLLTVNVFLHPHYHSIVQSTLTTPVVSVLVFPFYSPCSYLSNLPDYITLLIKILMASIIYGTKLKILSRAFKECWYSIPGNFVLSLADNIFTTMPLHPLPPPQPWPNPTHLMPILCWKT